MIRIEYSKIEFDKKKNELNRSSVTWWYFTDRKKHLKFTREFDFLNPIKKIDLKKLRSTKKMSSK